MPVEIDRTPTKPHIRRGVNGAAATVRPQQGVGPAGAASTVPGPTGPPGGSDAAFAGWINDTTPSATRAAINAIITALVDAAPSTLDTLNELAAALGDDPNFATTITALIGTKAAKSANLSDLANAATARSNLGLGNVDNTADSAKTITASQVSDFGETARDTLAAALVAGTGVTITPNDGADTITIASSGGGPLLAYKSADTSRASTTTQTNDPHLTLAVAANGVYAFEMFLYALSGDATPDLGFSFAIPSGASLTAGIVGRNAFDGDFNTFQAYNLAGLTMQVSTVGSALRAVGTLIVSSTSGTAVLQWAQNTSNANATVLKAGSWMRLTKLN